MQIQSIVFDTIVTFQNVNALTLITFWKILETVVRRCSVKKVLLEISQNSQENTCARVSFLNFIKKETLAQVFSCKFFQNFKNNFFYRTPLEAASLNFIHHTHDLLLVLTLVSLTFKYVGTSFNFTKKIFQVTIIFYSLDINVFYMYILQT